jgi:type IV pilus assembly protein PilA
MFRSRRSQAVTFLSILALVVMVVVVALPAWQRHRTQQHVLEAMDGVAGAKLAVMETAVVKGGLARIAGSDVKYQAQPGRTIYLGAVTVGNGGVITLSTRQTGAAIDPVLKLVPTENPDRTGEIGWTCILVSGSPNTVPSSCRLATLAGPQND